MQTRIEVENKGTNAIYYPQVRYNFYKGIRLLIYLIPIFGQFCLISHLHWDNMYIYYPYYRYRYPASFYELKKCRNYIDRYIAAGGIPDKRPTNKTTYIK